MRKRVAAGREYCRGQPAVRNASSSSPCSRSQSRGGAPVRAAVRDEGPEAGRVVRLAQVAELVHDDVVEHRERREREPPVERERPARTSTSPSACAGRGSRCARSGRRGPSPPPRRPSSRARAPPAAPRPPRSPARRARGAAPDPRACRRSRRGATRGPLWRSSSLNHGGATSLTRLPQGMVSLQRRARRERRTSTISSIRETVDQSTVGEIEERVERGDCRAGATGRRRRGWPFRRTGLGSSASGRVDVPPAEREPVAGGLRHRATVDDSACERNAAVNTRWVVAASSGVAQ